MGKKFFARLRRCPRAVSFALGHARYRLREFGDRLWSLLTAPTVHGPDY